jgi:hypothetical protein
VGHRGRLCVVAIASSVLTVTVGGLVIAPVVASLRRRLQHQYDTANTGPPEAVRMVDADYVGAGIWIVAGLAVVIFCAGAIYVARTTPAYKRSAVHHDLGRLGAGLLVAQAPLSMTAGLWGEYSSAATFGGAALGVAGALVLALERAPAWAYAAACAVAGAATMAVIQSAALLIPLVTGLAGILTAAAVTAALEAFHPSRHPRTTGSPSSWIRRTWPSGRA